MVIEREERNVLDYGVDNTGKVDATEVLTALHATGARIYYPNGNYLFNGATLDLSGGVRFESLDGVCIHNSISEVNLINFDKYGNLIGLMQNHLEAKDETTPRSGSLVSPPCPTENLKTKADFIPYWYNDFGRACQILRVTGWVGWHYWAWNHHDCLENGQRDPYDPQRHPLLGFYYGDDPVTLDWQCYWMRMAGVNTVSLLGCGGASWEEPFDGSHWIYQLTHNVPNFKYMKYMAMFPDHGTPEQMYAGWDSIIDQMYFRFNNFYTININGQEYPVLNIWDEKFIPAMLDDEGVYETDPWGARIYEPGTSQFTKTQALFVHAAKRFQEKGYPGVCIWSRQRIKGFDTPEIVKALEEQGVYRMEMYYEACYINGPRTNYAEMVDSYEPGPRTDDILNVTTGMHTHSPHPSNWQCPGHNPADFKRWIEKSLDAFEKYPERRRIITCYNIAEWAEGGPGLQPNVADGFGWLDAVHDTIVEE